MEIWQGSGAESASASVFSLEEAFVFLLEWLLDAGPG